MDSQEKSWMAIRKVPVGAGGAVVVVGGLVVVVPGAVVVVPGAVVVVPGAVVVVVMGSWVVVVVVGVLVPQAVLNNITSTMSTLMLRARMDNFCFFK
jgi:hypothetical protein